MKITTKLTRGRVFGGVAASLLYTSFESWVVSAYAYEKLPGSLIGTLFSRATFGNAFTAIGAGLAANVAVEV